MTTILFHKRHYAQQLGITFGLVLSLVLLWWISPSLIHFFSPWAGLIDGGIWQLVLLAFICWLLLLLLAAWLVKYLYPKLSLWLAQAIDEPFNSLTLWQHYVLYLALYALLVFSATGCLMAIC